MTVLGSYSVGVLVHSEVFMFSLILLKDIPFGVALRIAASKNPPV